ncbi:MAG: hypothetical protein LBC64_05480 [Fibromonadaceae bacterium]|jgi:hypothetical protein|nr:hypothetical protein [Fibromonadaceae bacterium]
MCDNDISVQNANIGGNFAGRDYNLNNSLNINNAYERSAYLQNLYEKVQREISENKKLREFCEDFNYINSDKDVIGLEEKLKNGSRENLIDWAKEAKERFHKKLFKHTQLSFSAQQINAYILSNIKRTFIEEIYVQICNNVPQEQINTLITERIIKPIKAELGINLFQYNDADIQGMIYFLTGNCHIKWSS